MKEMASLDQEAPAALTLVVPPTLHIQLLGGLRLRFDDTPITTIDLPRLQTLLAYLTLHRDASQSRQHLAFLLWPDSTEAQACANLRTLLCRLRRALPHADCFLHADAQTVQWRPATPWTLDVADFGRALIQAEAAERASDQPALRIALTAAVERYRGDLLPGWYDDWVLLERERLRQMFLAALERLILLLEGERAYAAAIDHAQRLLRHDPLHEATYRHLMRLHALRGDRASALRVYHTCVTLLERELGVEPSPATREFYEHLLRGEAPVVETPPAPAEPALTSDLLASKHHLPIPLSSFIGRTRELAEVKRQLANTRLLTLTGAGGCGKTRLALVAAAELVTAYHDGVWLVDLAALTEDALLSPTVAMALGIREEAHRPLIATLLDALRHKELLLLLDNCDHLIDACASLTERLLHACPQLRILATSRESLGIMGETTWLVPSLTLPVTNRALSLEQLLQAEAVRLFVERSTAALPTFLLTPENATAVVQICRRLDGMPLAIELAAARVKVLPVAQLAARLDNCFSLLTAGNRSVLPHQQTLRATIDWSYNLLSERERIAFRRLAVFAGGWTLEAAEAICSGEGITADQVLELLAHLVDKSLVVVEVPGGSATRYRLLETMQQYSSEKLRQAGEVAAVEQRHAAYYLDLAEAAEPELRGAQGAIWLEQLETEHGNVRAALEWSARNGCTELVLRLVGALWWFWFARGHLREGRRWLERALAMSGDVPPSRRAHALRGAGMLAWQQGDQVRAAEHYGESLALYRQLGDKRGIAHALDGLGWVAFAQSAHEQALVRFSESLALFQELASKPEIAGVLNGLGELARSQGDYEQARAHYKEYLALCHELNIKIGKAYALHNLGHVALHRGDLQSARACFDESMALCCALGHKSGIAYCLAGLAGVMAADGQPEQAARLFGAAEAVLESTDTHLVPTDRAEYERNVAATRSQLDDEVFTAAWAEGRSLPPDETMAGSAGHLWSNVLRAA